MSSDEEFLKRLHGAFLEEGAELLAAISNRISEIENSDNHDQIIKLLGKVLSSLHSLKGSARAVNESELVAICQNMEGAFGRIKQQNEETMPRVLALELPVLLEIVDTMSEFFDMDAGIAGDGVVAGQKDLDEIRQHQLDAVGDVGRDVGRAVRERRLIALDGPFRLSAIVVERVGAVLIEVLVVVEADGRCALCGKDLREVSFFLAALHGLIAVLLDLIEVGLGPLHLPVKCRQGTPLVRVMRMRAQGSRLR